jgi:signal transduction histidine kinase
MEQSLVAFPQKKIQIEKNLEFSPQVFCDPVHMREALLNLINNAMEAMSEDGKGVLSIRTFERRGKLVIQITDNGCGISKKNARYIGTPLFTTKVGKNHYGLGLYYVKKVTDLHEAQFDLRALPDAGSVAELVFPANRVKGE